MKLDLIASHAMHLLVSSGDRYGNASSSEPQSRFPRYRTSTSHLQTFERCRSPTSLYLLLPIRLRRDICLPNPIPYTFIFFFLKFHHLPQFTTMEKSPLPLAFQQLLYRRQTFQTLSGVFNGVMLWDFIICVPAELRYIFYPEIAALCSRSNNSSSNRLTIPSLL